MVAALASPMKEPRTFTLQQIGVVHSPYRERVDAPRQPRLEGDVEGRVELFPGHGYEDALCDLSAWDHIWLLFWFDRNEQGYTPKVQPPRSDRKRGVFATRAPYRPNPVGMSAVQLVRVDGLVLHVRGLDLLDGTPIVDVKPYVPYADAIPQANHGWLELAPNAGVAPRDPGPRYEVTFADPANIQLAWLSEAHAIDLAPRIVAQLALGPEPHAYRRIRREGDKLRLAIKEWRAWFRVEGTRVTVERIASGYKRSELDSAPAVHGAFCERFGG